MQDPPETEPPRRPLLLRLAPLAVMALVAVAAYASGVMHELTPAGLETRRVVWQAMAAAHPLEAVVVFVAAYAVLTGAGLPVALAMTLVGGVVLGRWVGGAATAVGATAAAILTYAAVRSAIGPWLLNRIRWPRLARMATTLRDGGFWLVFSLRLMPFMPFALVNAAAGAARTPLATYGGATLLGTIPSSFLYANLGASLGESLGRRSFLDAALRPQVVLSLAALAVLAVLPTFLRRFKSAPAGTEPDPVD